MSTWQVVALIACYLAVGVLIARFVGWLHRKKQITLADVEVTMVALVFLWPVMVPLWLAASLVNLLLFGEWP